VDREGKETSLVGDRAAYQEIALSPSGDSAAAVIEDPKNGATDIWIIDLQRNVRSRFTFSPGDERGFLWSPDGSKIVYSGLLKGTIFDLFIKPSSGSGSEELLFSSNLHKFPNDWSRDGRYIALTTFDPKAKLGQNIVILSMQDRKAKPFLETEFNERGGKFSPDGHWLLYISNESGQDETYLVPFPGPGGKWQVSTGGSDWAAWNARGDEIYFGKSDGTIMAVTIKMEGTNVQIGSPKKLFQNQAMADLTPAQDGQHFLILQGSTDALNAPITVVTNWVSILKKLKP